MILNLISLSTVKRHLGIASTTYDAQITAMIPIVSGDIRRILNNRFDKYVMAVFSSSDSTLSFASDGNIVSTPEYNRIMNMFPLGTVVYHSNLPADTYLQSFDPQTGIFTLSATPTGSGIYVYPSINISQFPTISKMIWYKVSKMNTTDSIASGVQSESYGPVSITYSDREINKKWDYPNQLIDDLGEPYARIG